MHTRPTAITRYVQRALQSVRDLDLRRPRIWDILLTACFLTAGLIDAGAEGWRTVAVNADLPMWLVLTQTFGFTLPLLFRRTHPMTTLLFMTVFAVTNNVSGAVLQISLTRLILVFNIALRLPLNMLVPAAVLIFGPLIAGTIRFPEDAWNQQFAPTLMSFALVALLGIAVRTRKEYTAALVERAHQLEVERDQQAKLSAAAERTRIAREMHDIIGHHLSVITGLADGGAYAAGKSPQRATQALDAIGTTSRQALTELRHLLGVLHEPPTGPGPAPAELSPQPGLADVDSLIAGVRAAGLTVDLTIRGTPSPTSAGRQLTVYRVVQEALTNTLKHAGDRATAAVTLVHTPDATTVTITDTGPHQAAHAAPVRTTGRGLPGMRERTALYNGTLEAAPAPTGGWRVHLRLPKESPQ